MSMNRGGTQGNGPRGMDAAPNVPGNRADSAACHTCVHAQHPSTATLMQPDLTTPGSSSKWEPQPTGARGRLCTGTAPGASLLTVATEQPHAGNICADAAHAKRRQAYNRTGRWSQTVICRCPPHCVLRIIIIPHPSSTTRHPRTTSAPAPNQHAVQKPPTKRGQPSL